MNASLEQLCVFHLKSVQEQGRKLFVDGRQRIKDFSRDTVQRKFSSTNIGLKLGSPGIHPVGRRGCKWKVFHILNGDSVTLFIVDTSEIGRIAC